MSRKPSKLLYLWLFIFFFFQCHNAWAWGPAVHAKIAMQVLENLALLAPVLRNLLRRYPNDFLYGNLSADIILGKKYIDYYYHCHNWRVGLEVLSHSKTDSEKAFAYGYLCHLAADVVAHNLFVPDKLVRSYHTIAAKHVYWEMRYDLRMDAKLLERAYRVAQHYHQKNDLLLKNVLRETLFSFDTNKKIFNGLLLLQKHVKVQKFMKRVAQSSPLTLEDARANAYFELAFKSVISVLNQLEKAKHTQSDPAGHRKLDVATELRKKIRKLESNGSISPQDVQKVVNSFHEILNETLLSPESCPDADFILSAAGKI